MPRMAGRATRATARTIFVICGLVSLVTCAPYVLLRGTELPVQSEWIVYAVALGAVGVFSVLVGLLPRSWLAKLGKRDRDDARLFSSIWWRCLPISLQTDGISIRDSCFRCVRCIS
jgi:hypothetical protein